MKRIAFVLVALVACKKKAAEPEPAPPVVTPPAKPPLPPLPPAKPGAAYVSLANGDLVRLDADGWKVLGRPYENHGLGLALGADGTLWAYTGDKLFRLDQDKLVEIEPPKAVTFAVGGSDRTLWATFDGSFQHFASDTWTPEQIPGADPVRSVAPAPEGVWVSTLDRTYRKDGATWTAIDVPGVTGQAVDIFHVASNGRGGVYLSTSEGIQAFDGRAWQPVPSGVKVGGYAWIVAGPGGHFAYGTSDYKRFYGDTSTGLHPLSAGDVPESSLTPRVMDDRGRTWADTGVGVIVFDVDGKIVRHWRSEEVPAFASRQIDIAVYLGGPAQLQTGERAGVTITGKVEGSAVGLSIVACAQAEPAWQKAPCEGIPTARRTTTTAGGRFSLEGVPLAPTYFWVERGGRWRRTQGKPCCADLPPDGTFDVGTLAFTQ